MSSYSNAKIVILYSGWMSLNSKMNEKEQFTSENSKKNKGGFWSGVNWVFPKLMGPGFTTLAGMGDEKPKQ